ncbi:MAG: acetolactate synthase small subunit [Kiritimatiellae bacterium]|nr:acetolactate synthase small subunit [Kiritimatiellia bacterium]
MKHTISCIVQNHAGVLAAIAGSFAEKGINIASLAVGETEDSSTSRMTIVVKSDESALDEVVAHLKDHGDVIDVEDIEREDMVERELMLAKVRAEGEDIAKVMQLVEVFRATVAGMGTDCLVIEMTGSEERVDALVRLLVPFGILELARTGRVAVHHHEEPDLG